MNILKPAQKLAVLSALVEGCSVRSVVRMTGVHKTTILKLLLVTGQQCQHMLDERMRGLQCQAVECDEIWSFIQKKQAHVTQAERDQRSQVGDVFTFVAFDPDTKAVITFHVGKRDAIQTNRFIADLSRRVTNSFQLSTDGWGPYIGAVNQFFGDRVDYAQIVKLYAAERPGLGRYAPPRVTGVQIQEVLGLPARSRISTSYVERNNLTLRMQLRRFTRLTNAFSRRLENLKAALSLWFWYYNFCRIHGSLRITPAMAAGVTERIWGLEELAA